MSVSAVSCAIVSSSCKSFESVIDGEAWVGAVDIPEISSGVYRESQDHIRSGSYLRPGHSDSHRVKEYWLATTRALVSHMKLKKFKEYRTFK